MNRCESIYFSVLFCRVPCGTGLFRVAALRLHSFAALRNRKRPLQSLSELNKKRGRRKNSWNFTNFAYDLFAVSTYTKCFKIFFQEEILYIKQYEKLLIKAEYLPCVIPRFLEWHSTKYGKYVYKP